MTINLSYDATIVANFGGNAAAFQTNFNQVAAFFMANYSDNINVNVNITSATGTGILGQSNTSIFSTTYANLRTAVVNDAKTADDATSVGAGGSVAAADPTAGADVWYVTRAQRKALGMAVDDLSTDGTITLGSGFTYDFDRSNGISAGAIDIQGVMAHELTEIMGRIGISLGTVGVNPSLTLMDAFAYTGAATRGLGFVANDYFSLDNGTSLLKQFNPSAGGDSRDWASGANDSFNAFSTSSVLNDVTTMDLREMDVLGYDRVTAQSGTPEPSTVVFLLSGLVAGGFLRRRAAAHK